MKLRVLIALSVTAASFVPRSEAQTNGLTPGTVVSWGDFVIPYVQPGTRYKAIAAGGGHSLALKFDGTVVAWREHGAGESDRRHRDLGGRELQSGAQVERDSRRVGSQ